MLDIVRMLLGMEEDEELDKKLNWLIGSAKARLKLLLDGIEPPPEMDHIIIDVAITRYNRIGSEGMTINNVEGENQHFLDSDFTPYMKEIQQYLSRKRTMNAGRARFL